VNWLRRAEIAFWVIGLSLLGGALAVIVHARVYQARQGRAFSMLERASSRSNAAPEPASTQAPDIDPLVLGRIEIPRIAVSAIVREGDDVGTLAVAVGHVPGTARPGEGGNMALAGHRDSFFRALRHIRVDDAIRIRTAGRFYDYRVVSTEVVGPGETRVLGPTAETVLTLVTCYPFGLLGHAPDRFVVRARLSAPRIASH
jgi:sortase A